MNKKGLTFNKQTAPKIASIGRSEGGSGNKEQARHRQADEAMSEETFVLRKPKVGFLVRFGWHINFFKIWRPRNGKSVLQD